jgi:hypothetical protein
LHNSSYNREVRKTFNALVDYLEVETEACLKPDCVFNAAQVDDQSFLSKLDQRISRPPSTGTLRLLINVSLSYHFVLNNAFVSLSLLVDGSDRPTNSYSQTNTNDAGTRTK